MYLSQEHPLGNAGHAGFYDGPHFDINEDGSDNVFFGAYFNRWGAFTDTNLLPSYDLAFGTFQREGDTMIFQNFPPELLNIATTENRPQLYWSYLASPEFHPWDKDMARAWSEGEVNVVVFKQKKGKDYYYGWGLYTAVWDSLEKQYPITYQMQMTAMCIVPNQHIVIGQTSIDPTLGIEETENVEDVTLRLSDGEICLSSQAEPIRIAILYNSMGQALLAKSPKDMSVTFSTNGLPHGAYFIRYWFTSGKTGCKKLVL